MTNPYMPPPPPSAPRTAPKWARKRYVLPALGVAFAIGVGVGGDGEKSQDDAKPVGAAPRPTATVTMTATATATATAEAEPAPTVTETVEVEVTETVTAEPAADAYGSGTSGGTSDSGGSAYYANCDAARAAGAAPVRVGDPGYGRHLDRDGDGVGCE
ncbi:excalibur calcium-binding domain-containing protein [Streptomyces broussonetiae]|uniref:Excalibur calcium-binding domain-containing protein n=1 Tax=Streptomyces broussonetiae TaxID=2686304 RepID=A0ABV5EI11_9ACTN